MVASLQILLSIVIVLGIHGQRNRERKAFYWAITNRCFVCCRYGEHSFCIRRREGHDSATQPAGVQFGVTPMRENLKQKQTNKPLNNSFFLSNQQKSILIFGSSSLALLFTNRKYDGIPLFFE